MERLIHHMLQHEGRPDANHAFNKATWIIEERAKKLELPRSSWSVATDDAGAAEHGSSTMDPPQLPPDITPDSPICSNGRGRSTHWNARTTLNDAVVSSDDYSLSPTSSIQSVGNHGSLLLNRANNPMGARIHTSTQLRPTYVPFSTFPEPAYAGVSAQPRSRPEQALRPSLSIAEAHSWKERKKRGERPELPGSENLASLNERDHIFLVDNSGTMKQYRKQVAEVVELLAYIVKASDDDGLDVHFTQTSQKFNSKSSKEMSNAALQQPYWAMSDMRGRLGTILQEHIKRFGDPVLPPRSRFGRQRSPHPQKPLSFYILTDAKWQPTDVGEIIKDLTHRMKAKGLPKDHVGIQFIRFGEDQASIEMLDKLDHGLGLKAEGM
ncbi:MAG: hypothetical protein LQ339_008265 [Xanthoria mediterranea]|nr:MAG: hypothetical protein LQ339_008265 [Xanthoria mediterranea]